jgi:uncharacterized protein YbbK (DUF523 family)
VRLVSACMLVQPCRYDGQPAKGEARALALLKGEELVPVCPEVAGGLLTPPVAARLAGGDGVDVLAGTACVLEEQGQDVSAAFRRGAHVELEPSPRSLLPPRCASKPRES